MEELLQFFKENKVSIQLTLDAGSKAVVHAFYGFSFLELYKTEADTALEALELMKVKMFG